MQLTVETTPKSLQTLLEEQNKLKSVKKIQEAATSITFVLQGGASNVWLSNYPNTVGEGISLSQDEKLFLSLDKFDEVYLVAEATTQIGMCVVG